jgi:hypothetical protein
MPTFLDYLVPSPTQTLGLGAVLLIALAFMSMGSVVERRDPLQKGRLIQETQLVSGWAITITIFTILGVSGLKDFTVIAAVLAAIAVMMFVVSFRRYGQVGPSGWWRILLLASPLLALGAAMTSTQWDELTSWLPNARYLVEHDAFPRNDLPASPAVFPAYPYGIPFIIYFSSRLIGDFVENAAALFNFLLYLSFGLFLVRLAASNVTRHDPSDSRDAEFGHVRMGWALCAFAGLLVTAFNPTYVSRLVFSSYADAPTSITVGFAGALTWMMLNALADGNRALAKSQAWQCGLVMTAMVALKQVNLVFLIALCLSALWITARDPSIKWRDVCRVAPYAVVLPVIVYGAWRLHVSLHLPGREFSFNPLSSWHVALLPDIISRMALVASKKGGYFGIMTVAVIIALRFVWRPRTAFERLTVLTAAMFLAYNGFLLLTYVAAFSEAEAVRVASYWRYNTHLGGVCLLFATYAGSLLWRKFVLRPVPRAIAAFCIVLVLALPIAMGKKLRFDLDPGYAFARSTAGDISRMLSSKDRLLLVDPLEDGGYLVIMRYHLYGSASIAKEITSWTRETSKTIRQLAADLNVSHIWIFAAEPEVTAALNKTLPQGHAFLLARDTNGWSVAKKWAHPKPRFKARAPTETP